MASEGCATSLAFALPFSLLEAVADMADADPETVTSIVGLRGFAMSIVGDMSANPDEAAAAMLDDDPDPDPDAAILAWPEPLPRCSSGYLFPSAVSIDVLVCYFPRSG